MPPEVTGHLRNWYIDQNKMNRIWGYIYEDSKGRFEDGTHVLTSLVVEADLKEGGFVQTQNSYYILGKRFTYPPEDNV